MKKSKKLTYITPQADIIDIEFPDVLCGPSCSKELGNGPNSSLQSNMAEEGTETGSTESDYINRAN